MAVRFDTLEQAAVKIEKSKQGFNDEYYDHLQNVLYHKKIVKISMNLDLVSKGDSMDIVHATITGSQLRVLMQDLHVLTLKDGTACNFADTTSQLYLWKMLNEPVAANGKLMFAEQFSVPPLMNRRVCAANTLGDLDKVASWIKRMQGCSAHERWINVDCNENMATYFRRAAELSTRGWMNKDFMKTLALYR